MSNEILKFSTNWNFKLNCQCFPALKVPSPHKYLVGRMFDIYLHDKEGKWTFKNNKGKDEKYTYIGSAVLKEVKTVHFDSLTPGMCMLDNGYGVPETQKLLKNMYPFHFSKHGANPPFVWLLFSFKLFQEGWLDVFQKMDDQNPIPKNKKDALITNIKAYLTQIENGQTT